MPDFYVIGPMAGYIDLNRTAFAAAADALRDRGYTVLNPHSIKPHSHPGQCPRSYATNPDGHSAACYLRPAIAALLTCRQAFVLQGWEASVGGRAEMFVAATVGIPIVFESALHGLAKKES